MADEIGADPRELLRLATTFLAESRRLGAALHGVRAFVPAPAAAYGASAGGAGLRQAGDEVVEVAGLAVERLVGVLEGDVDRLYHLAFSYDRADRQAAADLGGRA